MPDLTTHGQLSTNAFTALDNSEGGNTWSKHYNG